MLKELKSYEMQPIVGGSNLVKLAPTTTGVIYRDEDGIIRCGTPPWYPKFPKPWPSYPLSKKV